MKVLHIWNTAGVGSIIAKYMDKLFGVKSLVVHRKRFDPYGVTVYGELWDCGAKIFVLKCLWLARKFDIIHVHALDKIVPFLKILYPRKPVVLHHHGSDIRGRWSSRRKYWSRADIILYSTLDLLNHETPKHAVYMPNPIDTEFFHPHPIKPKPKTALHFSYNADDLARKYAEKYNLNLTIMRRGIPYLKLPETLVKYEYYIDVKRSRNGVLLKGSLSKTALEALACGVKVIRWDGKLVRELPAEHKPENVAKKILRIYQQIIA